MNLYTITQLAKTDVSLAAAEIVTFVQKHFPDLNITQVQVNQSVVSLNSVNGFLRAANGQEYFFKFHAEENEQTTVNEYYNTQELVKVGLPVIEPLFQNTTPGSQFLIYEKIVAPTGFELFAEPEKFFPAEEKLLKQVQVTYLKSLELTPAAEVAAAPIYQLFYHRLVGAAPRVDLYYSSNSWFQQLADKVWVINGKRYDTSFNTIIAAAKELLNPQHYAELATVVGHGDDHNANKFYLNGEFKYFDPAFAGRQSALLSFVKATAHNSFVHPDWLYTPETMVTQGLALDWKVAGDAVVVNHNWQVAERDPNRLVELALQERLIWKPLIQELRQRGWLPGDWQEFLRAALFCCPFLVYNLLDPKRYNETSSMLALSKCIELYYYDCNY